MSAPYTLLLGDCLDVLRSMESGSVDAVVTDPPYGLSFMSKAWDRGVPPAEVWAECLRVLRPGGRLLAFAGTRTMHRMWCAIEDGGFTIEDTVCWLYGSGFPKHGSKLKPGYEPVCVARKGPVSLLNIDGCRIPTEDNLSGSGNLSAWRRAEGRRDVPAPRRNEASGRWPANVVHDGSEEVMEAFAAFGERQSRHGHGRTEREVGGMGYHGSDARSVNPCYGNDTGTAARFFYCAKASRSDRGEGNIHTTVKSVALMRWLVRLVTPPGGTVLDPFTGSGSTGVACAAEGFRFVGIEREPEYHAIARGRLAEAYAPPAPLPLFAGDGHTAEAEPALSGGAP